MLEGDQNAWIKMPTAEHRRCGYLSSSGAKHDYLQHMDEMAVIGIPHFDAQIIDSCQHVTVVCCPRNHGNLVLGHMTVDIDRSTVTARNIC